MSIKITTRRSEKTGLPPGSLVHVGDLKEEEAVITVMEYDEADFSERRVSSMEEALAAVGRRRNVWINVDGLHQVELLAGLGEGLSIGALALEDVLNTHQRPKIEETGDSLFIVFRMFYLDAEKEEVASEQVSLFLGENYVVSFQESEGDVFDKLRARIKSSVGRVRKMGPDYLAYALMDAVVDNYFLVLEAVEDRLEELDEEVYERPSHETIQDIHRLKREVLFLRKSIYPLREVAGSILRSESGLLTEATEAYFRDLNDHVMQVVDAVDSYRELISGLLDVYLSSVSNRMNDVMKILTIISTIFIPLSFLAGVYGMNFDNMPETHFEWAYYVFWGVIIVLALAMVWNFKKRKWI